jgi:hypothetical protein
MAAPGVIEDLRYSIDVYDARGHLVEVLGLLADAYAARVAFKACCVKYPDKRIRIRERARVLVSYEPGG